MAEKRRSGIPRLVSKSKVSDFGVRLSHMSEQATSYDDNDARSLEKCHGLNSHTLKVEIDEHARTTRASVISHGHPVVARSKVLVRSKENVREVINVNQGAEEFGSTFKPPTCRVTTQATSHKNGSEVKFRTKQQLELDLHLSQADVAKLKHVIVEKDQSYHEKERKLKLESLSVRQELEGVQEQLKNFKTTLEQQGIDTVSLQSVAIDKQKILMQTAQTSDMAKKLSDLIRESTEVYKNIERDLTEVIDDCNRANGSQQHTGPIDLSV